MYSMQELFIRIALTIIKTWKKVQHGCRTDKACQKLIDVG